MPFYAAENVTFWLLTRHIMRRVRFMDVDRLQKMILDEVIRLGAQGYEKLAAKASISCSTLRKIARNGHMPSATTVHRLALACGRSEDEAFALTKERLTTARTA